MIKLIADTLLTQVRTLWLVFIKLFKKKDTVEYPDKQPYMFPRWRGRIILSRDPDGEERCAIFALWLVQSTVSPCRKAKWKMADGIRSFFASIFHVA